MQPTWEVRHCDVLDGLRSMDAGSVQCSVCSPPYWQLRQYKGVSPTRWGDGLECCLGLEPTPEAFIGHLMEVFDGVRRVLRDDGVCFVNIGDSYSSHGAGADGKELAYMGDEIKKRLARKAPDGLKPGDKCGIPERLALAMQAAGWYWRDTIIWSKKSPMPSSQNGWRWTKCRVHIAEGNRDSSTRKGGVEWQESHAGFDARWYGGESSQWSDCPGCPKCSPNNGLVLRYGRFRTTLAHEPVFMFAKSERYFSDAQASKEKYASETENRYLYGFTTTAGKTGAADAMCSMSVKQTKQKDGQERFRLGTGRNPRSVWSLATEPLKENHFAAYPTELVRKCLSMGTSAGGCCAKCGQSWAPIVEQKRVATRPGENSKIRNGIPRGWATYNGSHVTIERNTSDGYDREREQGNRDPERHISETVTLGYKATCNCGAESVPSVVLDPFVGSGTTVIVARRMGLRAIGLEASAEYAAMARRRIREDMPLLNQ